MRVKVFAVIPALLVLVSLCGSPVPPPPGTVTGAVFHDANRNSIRDSCDSPMVNTQVVVNGPDGESAVARTDSSGAFEIDDAPIGDGLVTLFTAEGLVWPITTAPQAVRVESSKEIGGVEIGSASKAVYDADMMSISGVIFADDNGNGTVDRDECSLISQANAVSVSAGQRIAVVSAGTYELKNMPADPGLAVTVEYGLYGSVVSFGGDPSRPLTPTNGSPGATLCSVVVTPRLRYGPRTYEANIGFAPAAPGAGIVTGIVFDDANEDGKRDAGEEVVSGASLMISSLTSECGSDSQGRTNLVTDARGGFLMGGLSPGTYSPQLSSPILDISTIMLPGWIDPPLISVEPDETTHVDLPVRLSPGASIDVVVFDDDNGNGARDSGEILIDNTSVCASAQGHVAGFEFLGGQYNSPAIEIWFGYPACFGTNENGVAKLGPLPASDYELNVGSGPKLVFADVPSTKSISLTAGQHLDVDLSVTILSPEEQVIPPGVGDSITLDICYVDPAWVQPDFDEGYDASVTDYSDVSREQALKIYGHGIYANNSLEMNIWRQIAKPSWGFEKAPPGCGYNYELLYIFAGYEPLEVVSSGNVLQVRLAKRGAGLFALNPPFITSKTARTELFVNEDNAPIVRCTSYGNYCEWNDGTEPNPYGGGFIGD